MYFADSRTLKHVNATIIPYCITRGEGGIRESEPLHSMQNAHCPFRTSYGVVNYSVYCIQFFSFIAHAITEIVATWGPLIYSTRYQIALREEYTPLLIVLTYVEPFVLMVAQVQSRKILLKMRAARYFTSPRPRKVSVSHSHFAFVKQIIYSPAISREAVHKVKKKFLRIFQKRRKRERGGGES